MLLTDFPRERRGMVPTRRTEFKPEKEGRNRETREIREKLRETANRTLIRGGTGIFNRKERREHREGKATRRLQQRV